MIAVDQERKDTPTPQQGNAMNDVAVVDPSGEKRSISREVMLFPTTEFQKRERLPAAILFYLLVHSPTFSWTA
jgi:hypothetical protein